MAARRWAIAVLPMLLIGAGCQGMGGHKSVASAEPPLTAGAEGTAVVEAPPPRTITFVDRHPLLSKPREYYNTTGNNKLAKAAAATVVGVPAGFVGEMRQIVVGRAPKDASGF